MLLQMAWKIPLEQGLTKFSCPWSEVKVSQSCLTHCNPWTVAWPGSSVHGILQVRILEWVAVLFSRGSSQPRDQTQVSRIAGEFFHCWSYQRSPEVAVNISGSVGYSMLSISANAALDITYKNECGRFQIWLYLWTLKFKFHIFSYVIKYFL